MGSLAHDAGGDQAVTMPAAPLDDYRHLGVLLLDHVREDLDRAARRLLAEAENAVERARIGVGLAHLREETAVHVVVSPTGERDLWWPTDRVLTGHTVHEGAAYLRCTCRTTRGTPCAHVAAQTVLEAASDRDYTRYPVLSVDAEQTREALDRLGVLARPGRPVSRRARRADERRNRRGNHRRRAQG